MPAFLVELPDSGGKTLVGASNSIVVFASNAEDARNMAANAFDGDSNALWLDPITIVTEITEGLSLPSNFELAITIAQDAGNGILVPVNFFARGGSGNVAIESVTIGAAAGLSYIDDEIVTLVGGVFTRAATVRCEGTGAVTAVDVVDPGEYTVLPTLDEIVTVTSGPGDDNLTLDGVAAAEDSYAVLIGQMVTLLNANSEIAGAAVDMSELLLGTRLFTVTDGGGGDDLGDSSLFVRLGAPHDGTIPSLVGAITHEGAANAVLSFALATQAGIVTPTLVRSLRSGH